MFEEQSFDQSVLKKLIEELSRTKKVRRRKKARALYLLLRVIYFSNLPKSFGKNW